MKAKSIHEALTAADLPPGPHCSSTVLARALVRASSQAKTLVPCELIVFKYDDSMASAATAPAALSAARNPHRDRSTEPARLEEVTVTGEHRGLGFGRVGVVGLFGEDSTEGREAASLDARLPVPETCPHQRLGTLEVHSRDCDA